VSAPARPLVLAAALGMVPALALGLGRFGYALLLPSMRADLGWSYVQASALTAANALGYLVGALLAARVAARISALGSTLAGCVVCAASIALCALTADLSQLVALRAAAGGMAFVCGAGLAAHLARATRGPAHRVLGIYTGGAGVGIVAAVAAAPDRAIDWPAGWAVLGLLGALATALVAAAAAPLRHAGPVATASTLAPADRRRLRSLVPAYAVFGAGYIGYMTFIVALLRAEGRSTATVLGFWAVLGAAAIVSVPLWTRLLRNAGPHAGPALVLGACGFGALLPTLSASLPAALASAVAFGGSFLAVVAAVSNSARTLVPAPAVTAAIGALTVALALGQSFGPFLGGLVADAPAGLRMSLALSALALLAGAGALARIDRPRAPATELTPTLPPAAPGRSASVPHRR